MSGIVDTIRRLEAVRGKAVAGPTSAPNCLEPLSSFGTDPGALKGWYYAPPANHPVALVVVLHGCTQSAAAYDHGSGWSDLARRFGFAVLYPEQRRANNPNLCFNWFRKEDTARGAGEASSIRQMIDAMTTRIPIDTARVFVTGLSAGGAMANVMLAAYPELFAGGSIIAGLPYGGATSVSEAMELMRGAGRATGQTNADHVRGASSHAGPWPKITVWHGDADRTVAVANADAIVDQWRALHGAASSPLRVGLVDGQRHRAWLNEGGEVAVEEYRIAGLGHGTPLKTGGADGCGNAGAYMLEAGISSTWRQAQHWGLVDRSATVSEAPSIEPQRSEPVEQGSGEGGMRAVDVKTTIERALRAAGLSR